MSYNTFDNHYAKDIKLPEYNDFQNLRSAKKFAIDIGGSLAKIVYLSEIEHKRKRLYSKSSESVNEVDVDTVQKQTCYSVEENNCREERLYFVKFETKYIKDGLTFIKENLLSYGSDKSNKEVHATGGGAVKYKDLIESTLDVKVEKEDEIECVINGCNFLLKHLNDECFEFGMNEKEEPELKFQNLTGTDFFPYLLVNIGSGVSIIKVEGPTTFERIGGTSTGGGTFWGLGSLLTNAKGFDELLEMAMEGKTKNVDMLVKDIYGQGYSLMKLPAELTASSFGKAARASRDHTSHDFRPQDIAKALLRMISNDIGQISSLYAQVHGLTRIVFAGYFIRGHPVTMHTMSYAVNFFSKKTQQALFLRHEGYLGAIGAFLASAASINGNTHWHENYAASIETEKDLLKKIKKMYDYDTFELDRVEQMLNSCPLLFWADNTSTHLIDLGSDALARNYWLDRLENEVDEYVRQAVESQPEQEDSAVRGDELKKCFIRRLQHLREFPYTFGSLSIMSLLDTRDQFLGRFSFPDTFLKVRQDESEATLLLFEKHLKFIDSLVGDEKHVQLIKCLLASNMFDYEIGSGFRYSKEPNFGFQEAMLQLPARPWLRDDMDKWIARLKEHPHELVVIFVDNSGIDLVLGVFPLVREFLRRGSNVILAANSLNTSNDVVFSELVILGQRIADMCPVIDCALKDERLILMETGTNSTCLDIRVIEEKLVKAMQNADLVLLEGVGRAIYTNYELKFACETIRLAVLKDAWLAEHFGGKTFDVIFKYEERYVLDPNHPSYEDDKRRWEQENCVPYESYVNKKRISITKNILSQQ